MYLSLKRARCAFVVKIKFQKEIREKIQSKTFSSLPLSVGANKNRRLTSKSLPAKEKKGAVEFWGLGRVAEKCSIFASLAWSERTNPHPKLSLWGGGSFSPPKQPTVRQPAPTGARKEMQRRITLAEERRRWPSPDAAQVSKVALCGSGAGGGGGSMLMEDER